MDHSNSRLMAGHQLFLLRKNVKLTPPYVLNELMCFELNALFWDATSGAQKLWNGNPHGQIDQIFLAIRVVQPDAARRASTLFMPCIAACPGQIKHFAYSVAIAAALPFKLPNPTPLGFEALQASLCL